MHVGICTGLANYAHIPDARFMQNELKQMILKEPKIFQEKPRSWHSQLAKTLLPLATVKEHQNVLVDMKLIPLRDVQTQTGELVTVTGAALQTLEGHSNVVSAVAFSPNGKQVASASGITLSIYGTQ